MRPSGPDLAHTDSFRAGEGGPVDVSLFFTSPAQAQFLEQLRQQVEAPATPLVLVTGPRGAGKTSLWFRLLGQPPRQWRPFRLDANPMLHPEQLLNGLALLFYEQLTANGPELRSQIPAAFHALRQEGRLPVLVVDDADQLPAASLALLLDLQGQRADDRPPFVLVLLAEPRIQASLTDPLVRSVLAEAPAPLALPPLEPDQVAPYIQHLLRVKGIRQAPALTAEQIEAIQERSGGLPGPIQTLVLRTLRERLAEEGRPLRAPRLSGWGRLWGAIALGGGMLLGLGWLLQDPSISLNRLAGDPATPGPTSSTPAITFTPSGAPTPAPAPEPDREADVPTAEPPDQGLAPPAQAEPVAEPAIPLARTPESGDPPSPPLEPAVAPPDAPQPPAMLVHLRGRDWLLRQRREAYTLQILAVADEQALRKFVSRYGIQAQAFYLESRRPDRSWFSLLHGIYPNRQAAKAALARLPEPLRQAGAWPRSLGSVQDEVRGVHP